MSKQQISKVMIINWSWVPELGVPHVHLPDEDGIVTVLGQSAIQVASGDTFSSENVQDKYLLPTRVEPNDPDDHTIKTARTRYLTDLIDKFRNQKETKKAQLLFLFHKTDHLTDIPHFLEIQKANTEDDNWRDIQFGTFGGGTGAMYDSTDGLLNNGEATFQYDFFAENGCSAFYEKGKDGIDEYKVLAIKAHRFDFIWNHYWLRTSYRLENLKKWILLSQVPHSEPDASQKAKELSESLLKKLISPDNDPTKIELGFSECEDLPIWTKADGKKFTEQDRDHWIEALRQFTAGKIDQQGINTLNTQFDKLISSWR
ncbi:MAG: hypothetical protein AAFQ87_05400 [Bacteroidota bacterium]